MDKEDIIFSIKLMNDCFNSDLFDQKTDSINKKILINIIKKIKMKQFINNLANDNYKDSNNSDNYSDNSMNSMDDDSQNKTSEKQIYYPIFEYPESLYNPENESITQMTNDIIDNSEK